MEKFSLRKTEKDGLPHMAYYKDKDRLKDLQGEVRILECGKIEPKWVTPEVLFVSPTPGALRTISTC